MQDHPAKPLFGKTALVTGAARRLGRASALMLAQAGADVAITFRNSARDTRATGVDLSGVGGGSAGGWGRARGLMRAKAGADVPPPSKTRAPGARETVVDLSGFGVR